MFILATNFHIQTMVQFLFLFNIDLGWVVFEKNKFILTSSIPYKLKAKIYNTYILPVLDLWPGLWKLDYNTSYSRNIPESHHVIHDQQLFKDTNPFDQKRFNSSHLLNQLLEKRNRETQ